VDSLMHDIERAGIEIVNLLCANALSQTSSSSAHPEWLCGSGWSDPRLGAAHVKLTRQFHFNRALFSIVPLLNVLFLVLIFYALATRFVLQPRGCPIVLPASTFTVTPQEDAQIVSVTSAPAPASISAMSR
jgi:hypothetical protein